MLHDGEYRAALNGVEHWYRVAGLQHQTPPMVVLHGGPGGNVYAFERTIGPMLEAFATVVYYDQRGCGRSHAPVDEDAYSIPLLLNDLDTLRQHLQLEKIIPLGFSFGGELALEYALAYPQHTLRVIAQAPGASVPLHTTLVQLAGFALVAGGDTGEAIRRLAMGSEPDPETRLREVWSLADTTTVDRFLFHQPEAARRNRQLWQESGLANTGAMARALAKHPAQRPLLVERVGDITQPTLILVGLHDRNSGVDANRNLQARMPQGQLVVFAHSAHFPDIEEPERYAEIVRDFVQAPM